MFSMFRRSKRCNIIPPVCIRNKETGELCSVTFSESEKVVATVTPDDSPHPFCIDLINKSFSIEDMNLEDARLEKDKKLMYVRSKSNPNVIYNLPIV